MRFVCYLSLVTASLAVPWSSHRIRRLATIQCLDTQRCVVFAQCRNWCGRGASDLTLEERRNLKPCGYSGNDVMTCCNEEMVGNCDQSEPLVECGVKQFDQDIRIAGGFDSLPGSWPWMARLLYKLKEVDSPLSTQCGGALISTRHVVTAAHCLQDEELGEPVAVVLGEADIRYEYDRVNGEGGLDGEQGRRCQMNHKCADRAEQYKVRSVIVHQDYSSQGVGGAGTTFRTKFPVSDIGLVVVEGPVTFTNYVQPVCLPNPARPLPVAAPSQPLVVTGWGNTEKGNVASQNALVLQELRLDEVPLDGRRTGCRGLLGRDLLDQQICVATGTTDAACQGDSGGPVSRIVRNTNQEKEIWELAGVVSFGTSICGQEVPLVATRVGDPVILTWITDQMSGDV